MTAVNKPTIVVNVTGARGPRGPASGPLTSGSVGSDEISDNSGEKAAILTKIGGIAADDAVPNSGASTINGVKTFTSSPVVPAPTTAAQVATKGYVDGLLGGTQIRTLPMADAATITALPASTYNNGSSGIGATITGSSNGALPAIDDVTLTAGSRVMVLNEAAPARNGLYTVTQVGDGSSPFILTRNTAADSAEDLGLATVFIAGGTTLAGATLQIDQKAADIVIGTTAITAHGVRIADAEFDEIVRQAADAAIVRKLVFRDSVEDEYLRSLVTGLKVEQGDAGHDYILNYETLFIGGGPLYRVRFFLTDVTLGIEVAEWSRQAATDWTGTYSETVFLTQVGDGTPFTDYSGVTATAWIDWNAVDWTKALTTYTTAAEAGVRPEHVVTNHEMDDFYVRPKPALTLTVGAEGDFATILAAVQSLYIPDATITRSSYPCSDICTYSHQVLVEVIDDGYTEALTGVDIGGTDQSPLLIPHYMTLRLRQDTVLSMNTPGISAPVIEAPFSCAIERGRIYQGATAGGYVLHEDNLNVLTKRATVGPEVQRFRHRHVYRDVHFDMVAANAAPLIGAGISDASGTLVEGCRFTRAGTATNSYHFIHTTEDCLEPGWITWRNCIANDASVSGSLGAIEVLKSDAQTVQHTLTIENCDIGKVTAGNSEGGASGFVRRGRFDGFTYTSMLDPA